jgi:molecular chaperone GrpE (heat shock protein)
MSAESTETTTKTEVKNGNYSMDNVRSMVRQLNELDAQMKELREERKRVVADFVDEYNVPLKEVKEAVKMAKSDIDPEVTASIYAHIADLVEQK